MSQKQASLRKWGFVVKRRHHPPYNNNSNINSNNNYSTTLPKSYTQLSLNPTLQTSPELIRGSNKRKSMNQQNLYNPPCAKRHKLTASSRKKILLSQQQIHPSSGKLSTSYSNHLSWGNNLIATSKPKNTTRIAFRNINSLPPHLPDPKHDQLINDIRNGQFDIIGLAETNLRWHNLPDSDKPRQRFKGIFEHTHIAYSYNTQDHYYTDKRQSGGTAIISRDISCNRIITWGSDERKLGRWSWVQYRGSPSTLRIITIYRPVSSQNIQGAYKQQQTHLLSIGIDICPRTLFLDDLTKLVLAWQSHGDHIIILGDFNESISSKTMCQFCQKCNLRDGISYLHGTNTPNTYQHGTKTIDGILISNDICTIHAGYTAVDWGTTTDHRLLWIDIHNEGIFKTHEPPPWKPTARRLKRSDPRTVHSFVDHRLKHAQSYTLLEKVQDLQMQLSQQSISHPDALATINELDNIRTQGILEADTKCRRLCMGNIPWSPALSTVIFEIQYYKKHINSLYSNSINSRTLYKLRKRANITIIPATLYEAKQRLSSSYDKFKQLKLEGPKKRQTFLEELAAANAITKGIEYEAMLKQIRDREHIKSTFNKIKYVFRSQRSNVTQVEAPDHEGNWSLKDTKIEVETGCMNENMKRFTQASHTPLMQNEAIQLLGWTANTPTAQAILNDTTTSLQIPLPPALATLAPLLSTPPAIQTHGPISTSLSHDDMVYFCMRNREMTSTGPSGLHYGHFQSSCTENTLNKIDRSFLEMSMTHGLILNRWLQATDVMIPKKSTSIRVDSLRTIMLFECDWNMMNKIISKRTMILAEKTDSIAPEQYGSRHRKSAIQHATNKQILFDLIRQRKDDVVLIILDAKACYDRIVIPFASICLQRQGVPQHTICIMFKTLSRMKHFIRTHFGDSTIFYVEGDTPFHGIGQGNGAGPMIWVTVSTPLLNHLRNNECGYFLKTSTSGTHQFTAFTFVDDNDIVQGINNEVPVHEQAQRTLDLWEDALRTTGGACAPEKSAWTALLHHWNGSRWTLRSTRHTPGSLLMKTDHGNRTPLQHLKPTDASKALGIMFSPSGQMNTHYKYLLGKCLNWAERIRRCNLSRSEVHTAMSTTIWKTIEYSLQSTTFTEKQCSKLANTILSAALPRMGLCRNIDRRPLFSSTLFQGFDLKHPYCIQGLKKLKLLLDPSNCTTSLLIQESINSLQLECGLGPQFFSLDPAPYKCLIENTWVSSLWQFLHDTNISLKLPTQSSDLRFPSDTYLMSAFSQKFHKNDLKSLNFCRLYLKVITLSDIISLCGRRIKSSCWKGFENNDNISTSIWPNQPKPSGTLWNLWQKALQHTFHLDSFGQFLQPINFTSFLPLSWKWFYDMTNQRIYEHNTNGSFTIWLKVSTSRSRKPTFHRSTLTNTTNIAFPCTIVKRRTKIALESYYSDPITNPTCPPSLPLFSKTMQTETIGNKEALQHEFMSGNLIIVSDGSYKSSLGSGAWIITSRSIYPLNYIAGSLQSPGKTMDQDSHRAEVTGIYGALETLITLSGTLKITQPITVQYACDNLSALQYSFNNNRYPYIDTRHPDFDILQAIRHCQTRLPFVHFAWSHVKGHQDQFYGPLSFPATLNVQADKIASVARSTFSQPIPTFLLPSDNYILTIQNERIGKNFEQQIYDYISASSMMSFWEKKRKLTHDTFFCVDWDSIHKASSTSTKHTTRWINKHATGICGTNNNLLLWKQRDDDTCPRCDQPESSIHVWRCQGCGANELWTQHLSNLEKWLESQHTAPMLQYALLDNLRSWLDNTSPKPSVRSFIETAQDLIGWDYILEGVFSIEWSRIQQQHLLSLGRSTSGHTWLVRLIKRLWEIAWNIWLHRNSVATTSNNKTQTLGTDTTTLFRIGDS